MAQVTEGNHIGEFIIGEIGDIAKENATLVSGQNIVSGTVLGEISTAVIDRTGTAGDGVIGAVTFGAAAQAGIYTFLFLTTGATATAQITAPDGSILPNLLTVGTDYVSDHLSISVADGGTDFTAAEFFLQTVTKKVSLHNNAATDGSQHASSIAYSEADATAGDLEIVTIARNQLVAASKLTWKAGISSADKAVAIANLANKNILVRG